MTVETAAESADGAGPTRSVGMLLGTLLAGSVLLPTLQQLAAKAGEDLYGWLRHSLPGRQARAAEERLLNDGQVALVDPARRVVFQLPADLSEREAAVILRLRLPATDPDTWLLVRKDYARRVWVIETTAGPPEHGVATASDGREADLPSAATDTASGGSAVQDQPAADGAAAAARSQ